MEQHFSHHELRGRDRKKMINIQLAELRLCSNTKNLDRGKEIHSEARKCGTESCSYVASALVNMYAKCGSMADARQVFENIKQPDMVSWNSLILGYVDNGIGLTALELFERMKSQGFAPDSFTFVAALKACSSLALEQEKSQRAECLERGKQIHPQIGSHVNIYVKNTLIDMYAICGSMGDAHQVFDGINRPNVVSWNSIILGYADNGDGSTALDLFAKMKYQGCDPDSITFVAALKACTCLETEQCREWGMQIQAEIGSHLNVYVQSALINMYSNCSRIADARHVFNGIKQPNVVCWNALIMGYAENGEAVTALDLFTKMKSQGFTADSITFVAALKACAMLGALESGTKIHSEIDFDTQHSANLVTCLVDFYAKCGNLVEAQRVFDVHPTKRILATWNVLLAGYSRLGGYDNVLKHFQGMQDAGFHPDAVSFLCMLTCCTHTGRVKQAHEIFEAMSTKYGVPSSLEHYTCMVDILGRSNKMDDSMAMLRNMPCRPDSVTWMAVLYACRTWENVGIGKLAFMSVVSLDDTNAAAYVLMAQIYGNKGMWEEQDTVLGMRTTFK